MHCCRCRLFAVSGGRVLCIVLSSCRERTPGVPRKKTWADAVRSVDGETLYYRKNYTINCFNQCNKCPSNARFVIFFTSTVADAARRHGLRIACGCVPRRERSLRRSSSPKKVTLRLCCSLVNALATRRLATNFFRYQADRFPLVGNAHRAFRGEKHGQMPCGLSTGKS